MLDSQPIAFFTVGFLGIKVGRKKDDSLSYYEKTLTLGNSKKRKERRSIMNERGQEGRSIMNERRPEAYCTL
jgi:hypothetical protein